MHGRIAVIAAVLLTLACDAGTAEPLRTLAPGMLRVGTYFVNPPFEYVAKGADVGFEVDLMEEISRWLGLKPIFINTHRETTSRRCRMAVTTASWEESPSRQRANGYLRGRFPM
jgi:ABC-type amino acid transport substrate-binding protein